MQLLPAYLFYLLFFIHSIHSSFIHSFIQQTQLYSMPGITLNSGEKVVNKTDPLLPSGPQCGTCRTLRLMEVRGQGTSTYPHCSLLLVHLFLSFFFFFFWPCLQHVECPGPGIKNVPQQWQCQVLNPLCHQGTPVGSSCSFLWWIIWFQIRINNQCLRANHHQQNAMFCRGWPL